MQTSSMARIFALLVLPLRRSFIRDPRFEFYEFYICTSPTSKQVSVFRGNRFRNSVIPYIVDGLILMSGWSRKPRETPAAVRRTTFALVRRKNFGLEDFCACSRVLKGFSEEFFFYLHRGECPLKSDMWLNLSRILSAVLDPDKRARMLASGDAENRG